MTHAAKFFTALQTHAQMELDAKSFQTVSSAHVQADIMVIRVQMMSMNAIHLTFARLVILSEYFVISLLCRLGISFLSWVIPSELDCKLF